MRCQLFRTDPPTLLAALTEEAMLVRYQDYLAQEIPSLAEQTLIRHLRRLSGYASQVLSSGFETVARNDLPAVDELLSDVFAVATFLGWDLPMESLGDSDQDLTDLPRGLLGADRNADSARVWLLDGATVALSRARTVSDTVDMTGHNRAPPP